MSWGAYFQIAGHPDMAGEALFGRRLDARKQHALEGGGGRQMLGAASRLEAASAANALAATPKDPAVIDFAKDLRQAGSRGHFDGPGPVTKRHARHVPTMPERCARRNIAPLNMAATQGRLG